MKTSCALRCVYTILIGILKTSNVIVEKRNQLKEIHFFVDDIEMILKRILTDVYIDLDDFGLLLNNQTGRLNR